MHENYREYVDRIVDSFPPLTDEQRSKLRMLLAHPPCSECEARHRVEHATATPALLRRRYPPIGDLDLWVRYGPDGPPDGGGRAM